MNKEKSWKFIKFCFDGGTSELIGLIFFNILFWFGLNFVICVILSMLLSIIYNFSMNSNIGYNLKPQDLQCAMGLGQMDILPEFIKKKKENFQRLY